MPRILLGALFCLGLAVSPSGPADARTPFPFFRQVERVGLLCTLDIEPAAHGPLPDAAGLCASAAAELAALLADPALPVTVLVRNDERIADPGTLTVLLHGHVVDGPILALSATLHRARPDLGAPPFFVPAPEAVGAPAGRALDPERIRPALRRLLSGIVRPLLANR